MEMRAAGRGTNVRVAVAAPDASVGTFVWTETTGVKTSAACAVEATTDPDVCTVIDVPPIVALNEKVEVVGVTVAVIKYGIPVNTDGENVMPVPTEVNTTDEPTAGAIDSAAIVKVVVGLPAAIEGRFDMTAAVGVIVMAA